MLWHKLRGITIACGVAGLLSAACADVRACCLLDRLFGCGGAQTTYYSPPYAAPACGGCSTCAQPACGSCAAAPYRAYYRPAVAYMPVVGVNSCTGCAVTAYRPVQAWAYPAYRVAYAAPYAAPYASCGQCAMPSPCAGSCGSPCSGGCASGGCAVSGYVPASGCSTCGVPAEAATQMPTRADMSAPANLAPAAERPSTFGPAAPGGATAPAAPGGNGVPALRGTGTSFEGPVIQGLPPVDGVPRATPAPTARPEGENRTAALPVYQASQFQLIPSPIQPTPVYPASGVSRATAASEAPIVDEGWRPAAR
jgi:hypothetical protein